MDARLKRQLIYGLLLLFVLGMLTKVDAQPPLNVAVAANFAPAMEEVSNNFTSETGIPVQLTISSSGRLFAQIQNHAPFDLYFSADTNRPEILHREGFCSKPELYATGRVVLWSRSGKQCSLKNWKDVVQSPEVKKIAVANPSTAPYGTVAIQTCTQLKNWPFIEKKLVYGTNVGQAFQYVQAGVAQVSFVSLSFARSEKGTEGCFWEIPESLSVEQMACVITNSANIDSAELFLRYVTSVKTTSVREQFGYN